MKKENLLLTIIVLLVFIIGYIFGSTFGSNSQRYYINEFSNGNAVIDSELGIVYFKEKGNKTITKYDFIEDYNKQEEQKKNKK